MNRRTASFIAACVLATASTAFAQDQAKGPKGAGALGYAKVTATVEAIDQSTRTVTLKGEGGNTHTFVVGPDVKNLAQVSKGDIVTLEYAQALLVGVEKTTSKTRERVVTEGAKTAKPGDMPAAIAARDVSVVASVESLDKAKGTVTLRGPERTVTVKVRDPAMLKDVKAGDFVKASYTEAVAVSVAKPAAAPKK
jgi:Cu/Ag efflux protein CusF